MKPTFAFIFLFSLLLFAEVNYARVGPGDYWKKIMKDQPMPESIRDLIHQESSSGNEKNSMDFVRDFDTRPNAIIYHSHGDAKGKKHRGESAEKGEDERLKMPDDQDHKKMTSA